MQDWGSSKPTDSYPSYCCNTQLALDRRNKCQPGQTARGTFRRIFSDVSESLMLTAYLAAGKCDFTRVFRACSLIEPTAHIKRWRVEMQRDGFLCVACILDTMQPQRIYRNTKKSNVKSTAVRIACYWHAIGTGRQPCLLFIDTTTAMTVTRPVAFCLAHLLSGQHLPTTVLQWEPGLNERAVTNGTATVLCN